MIKKHSLILLIVAVFLSACHRKTDPTQLKIDSIKAAKAKLITILVKSKTDSSEVTLKADSLYGLLNKTLVKSDEPKNWFDNTVDSSDKVSKLFESWKSIIVLILSGLTAFGSWRKKGKIDNTTKEKVESPVLNVLMVISLATFAGILIYLLAGLFGAVIGYIVQLLGYALLIAPAYWYVYSQDKKAETKCCIDELTQRKIKYEGGYLVVRALISNNGPTPKARFYFRRSESYIDASLVDMAVYLTDFSVLEPLISDNVREEIKEQIKFWFIDICNSERMK